MAHRKGLKFFYFSHLYVDKRIDKKIGIFCGGYSQFGPSKEGPTKKLPPMTVYDPAFYYRILFYYNKEDPP